MQHGRLRVALSRSDGASRACGRSTDAQADSRTPGAWPQHPAVRSKARSCRPPTCRVGRGANAQHRRLVRCRNGRSRWRGTRSRSMNTQSTAMPESFDSQRIAPGLSATQPLLWSVRRELWEYRSIYVAPLAVAAVMLFGFLIATIGRAMSMDPARRAAVLTEPNDFAALLIMGTAFIVGVF